MLSELKERIFITGMERMGRRPPSNSRKDLSEESIFQMRANGTEGPARQ